MLAGEKVVCWEATPDSFAPVTYAVGTAGCGVKAAKCGVRF